MYILYVYNIIVFRAATTSSSAVKNSESITTYYVYSMGKTSLPLA